jgi:hypothetical protein
MPEAEPTHGISCPNCGGMVPIPEGERIVCCPYCDLRSMVRGERGIQRYQIAPRVTREQATQALRTFLKSHRAIAGDTTSKSSLAEVFLAYIPFWTGWSRVLSWVFGQKQVGSGDHKHYEAREVKVVQDLTWNGAACDVGEFGVESVPLTNQKLDPFDADSLHDSGMVFEPVGSTSDARQAAANEFQSIVQRSASLDRVSQTFTRFVRQRFGLVYYPLRVLRYLYKGRSFQVVVDGHSGQTLYGKAPGSTFFRAATLIGGMAAGAFVSIDVSVLLGYLALQSSSDDSGGIFGAALAAFVIGFGLMFAAYRKFRYGEQFEYRRQKPAGQNTTDLISKITDVEKWLDQLS